MTTHSTQMAQAHVLRDDPGSYNPSNIISNDAFLAYGYDGTGVNNFLSQRGSWLASYNIPEYQNVPYKYRDSNGNCTWDSVSTRQYTDSTHEALYGGLAGDLIARKGHEKGINPQVILATLEKESSAISSHSPLSTPTEMWVLGYGWNDVMAACGYDQSSARQRAIDYGGVGQQIAYATNFFRTRFNRTDWQGTFTTGDGISVSPANQATFALYEYTPYAHNGNHNFWHFFTLWFQTRPVFSPTAYGWDDHNQPSIVYNGVRWPFNDIGTFESFIPGQAGLMGRLTDQYLALPRKYPLGRLIKKQGDGTMYYMIDGIRRHVNSERVLKLYGWRDEDVIGDVDDKLIDAIPVGDPMLPIVRIENSSTTFLQTRGENHRVTNQGIFQDNWKFNWSEVIEVPPYEVNLVPTTNDLGMISLSNEGTAYLMDNGKRYHIPDNNTAARWGLNWNTAIRFDTNLLNVFPEDRRLTPYARNERGFAYILENGQKRYLSNDRINQLHINTNDIVTHSNALMDRIPEGPHY